MVHQVIYESIAFTDRIYFSMQSKLVYLRDTPVLWIVQNLFDSMSKVFKVAVVAVVNICVCVCDCGCVHVFLGS